MTLPLSLQLAQLNQQLLVQGADVSDRSDDGPHGATDGAGAESSREGENSLKRKQDEIDEDDQDFAGLSEEEKRKAFRQKRNRLSAQMSRDRKKNYVAELEHKVQTLIAQSAQISTCCKKLLQENRELRTAISIYQGTVGPALQAMHASPAVHSSLGALGGALGLPGPSAVPSAVPNSQDVLSRILSGVPENPSLRQLEAIAAFMQETPGLAHHLESVLMQQNMSMAASSGNGGAAPSLPQTSGHATAAKGASAATADRHQGPHAQEASHLPGTPPSTQESGG